jgi:putative endopeptidase
MPTVQRPKWVAAAAALSLLFLAGSGCSRRAPESAGTSPPAATTPKPQLGSFGFDATGMDREVKPGDDFFEFVNGTWVRNTEIPADRASYGTFVMIHERVERDVRAIVEGAANDTAATGDRRKIGDAFTAFMDEARIESLGLTPLKHELEVIAAIDDRASLARLFGQSLRADVDLLNATDTYTDRLFGLWVTQHLRRPDEVAPYLVQGGLGMPDRDYYLAGGKMADIRKAYEAHLAKLLALAGIDDAEARAARILALETAIARVHATQEQTNDVRQGDNEWQRADFPRKAPGLDWDAFFEGAQLAAQPNFIVWQPRAIAGISQLAGAQPLEVWKDYLTVRAIDRASSYLPKAFADQRFAFYGTVLAGTPQQRDRWKRSLNAVDAQLGEAVGKLYVEQHFSPETKARADEMVKNVVAAFARRIDALDWMAPATKETAKAKIAGIGVGMGYPSKWIDYSALEIRPDDALGNAQRSSLFEYQRNLAKLGKPVDREEWFLLPHEVNALNVPLENRMIFPASILQAPFFDGAADDAVNYGSMGAVIGHEISHSFDNMGALFDERGRMHNWWTPEDQKRFEKAGDALAKQYDGYRPFPDLGVNGRLTLGENIADVAGLATAWDAYQASQEGKPPQVLDGFTPAQRFFLGFGQSYRAKEREPALRNALLADPHAPDHYRAQTVRNVDAWYEAFDVKPGEKLYLAPDQRVKVW